MKNDIFTVDKINHFNFYAHKIQKHTKDLEILHKSLFTIKFIIYTVFRIEFFIKKIDIMAK